MIHKGFFQQLVAGLIKTHVTINHVVVIPSLEIDILIGQWSTLGEFKPGSTYCS